jgi:hypothetical protein
MPILLFLPLTLGNTLSKLANRVIFITTTVIAVSVT